MHLVKILSQCTKIILNHRRHFTCKTFQLIRSKKWIPPPGSAYRSKKALEHIISAKKRLNKPIVMREERNLYGEEAQKKVLKTKKISNKRKNKKMVIIKPNAASKMIQSEILQFRMRVKMTMSVMEAICRAGSLDNYILNSSERQLRTAFAINLKRKMEKRMAALANFDKK